MARMCTLHEIAMSMATKQPGMVDSLTEDAPILRYLKWIPATHKLWNVAEKLTEIKGAAFTGLDHPLPVMKTSSDLIHTDLSVMGGIMEVPYDRAVKFGGPEKYFADRQDHILKKAGMDTEIQIVDKVLYAGAYQTSCIRDAGGPNGGWWLLAVRFDDLTNVGLYDPDQFDAGRLLTIDVPYGGQQHYLRGEGYEGVLGYTIVYRAHFGYQLIEPKRCVSAIVNIDKDHYPTIAMIDDMLADVRATNGNTFIFCGPRAKTYGIHPHKDNFIHWTNGETSANTVVENWNGIPIVTSHNLNFKKKVTKNFITE